MTIIIKIVMKMIVCVFNNLGILNLLSNLKVVILMITFKKNG